MFAEEDSDTNDSINTDTTAGWSDEEFPVEKVLAERIDGDGTPRYLVKWEGWQLGYSSWEEAGAFADSETLAQWDAEKQEIAAGRAEAFDVNEWDEANCRVRNLDQQKADRRAAKRRKREAKAARHANASVSKVRLARQRRARSSSYEDDPILADDVGGRPKSSVSDKKGIARTTSKKQRLVDFVVSDDEVDEDDGTNSEEDKPLASFVKPKGVGGKKRRLEPTVSSTHKKRAIAVDGNPTPGTAHSHGHTAPSKPSLTSDAGPKHGGKTTTAATFAQERPPSAKRPAAPAIAPSKVFGNNWAKAKPQDRTREYDTKARFTNLAMQNNYQKSRQNEPAPNPAQLTMIDPKTGKVEQEFSSEPKQIHKAYGRRSPPRERRRSPSPLPSARVVATIPSEPPIAARNLKKLCIDHQAGSCKWGSKCDYSHSIETSRKSIPCRYWSRPGGCWKTEAECEFAHHYPGVGSDQSVNGRKSSHDAKDNSLRLDKSERQGRSNVPEKATTAVSASATFPARTELIGAPGFRNTPTNRVDLAARAKVAPHDSPLEVMEKQSPLDPRLKEHMAESSLNAYSKSQAKSKEPTKDNTVTSGTLANAIAAVNNSDPRLRGRSIDHSRNVDSNTETQQREESTLPGKTDAANSDKRGQSRERRPSTTASSSDESKFHARLLERYTKQADVSQLLMGSDPKPVEFVMLFYPRSREQEHHQLVKWFQRNNCKVYTSRLPNHWPLFCSIVKHNPALVVFHPDETFVGVAPGLHNLICQKSPPRVYSLGVSRREAIMAHQEGREPVYQEQRLFSSGRVTFISDDVFYFYPEKATQIITKVLDSKHNKPGQDNTKIGARPGIKEWLRKLADKKFHEQGGSGQPEESYDWRWRDAYRAVWDLCPPEDEDVTTWPDYSVPSESSYLFSGCPALYPSFNDLWEKDQAASTALLVEIFADYAAERAAELRQAVFVYARPEHMRTEVDETGAEIEKFTSDPNKWTHKYNHIGVCPPEAMLGRSR